jgi:hypothetical protein
MVDDKGTAGDDRVAMRWIVLTYLGLVALNIWLLWVLPNAPALEKVAFVLALVGLYSLALNFSKDSGLAKAFPSWLHDSTSPSLRSFAAGAFRTLSVLFALGSQFIRGFPPPLLSPLRVGGTLLALPLALVAVAVLLAITVAYLVVIVPLAYVAYLFAGVFLDAVENAPGDVVLSSEEGVVTVRTMIQDHRAELRTLVVGVPSTVVGIGTTAFSFL